MHDFHTVVVLAKSSKNLVMSGFAVFFAFLVSQVVLTEAHMLQH